MLQKCKKVLHFLLAYGAYLAYGRPSRKLIVIGVTGTKGKSTTCRLIASVLEAGGHKVGLLSTVEFQIGEQRWLNDKKMTMLGRGQIQHMLQKMVKAGCEYAVVETSSEGILQYRHIGLNYDVAVFTNLGTEHSERHGGFENLKKAKGRLFAALNKRRKVRNGQKIAKVIVANNDDPHVNYFASFSAHKKIIFGLHPINNQTISDYLAVQGTIQEVKADGTFFNVGVTNYHLRIIGEFNVYNALAAIGVGISQGITEKDIIQGLNAVEQVPGRMEFVEAGQPFKVLVDYAHEPLSLAALFTTLRTLVGPEHKVIGVIGSDGGGRDVQKRPRMGEVAGNLCDYVVITDVNPHDDNPSEIIEMLAIGSRNAGKKDGVDLFTEIDRRAGIKKALSLARPGDAVAITAKGTEPCIVVANDHKIPWDDRQVAKELLRELNASLA